MKRNHSRYALTNIYLTQLWAGAALLGTLTFVPIYARDELGISDTWIGVIASCYSFALFFSSYLFGRLSDIHGRRLFIWMGLLASGISLILYVFTTGMYSFLGLRILTGFCFGIYPAAFMAYTYERGNKLGKFISFGSLGWGIGSFLCGIAASTFFLSDLLGLDSPVSSIFPLTSFFFFLAFAFSTRLETGNFKSIKVPFFPIKVIKHNLSVYASVLIRHSGATMIWVFWPLYLQGLGISLFEIGVVQATNMSCQFTFMYIFSDKLSARISVAAGIILSALSFFSFTLAQNFIQILIAQPLLAFSWSLMFVGGMRYLSERNLEKATSTGLLNSTLSLSAIIGPILATVVIQFGDYYTLMYLATIMATVSFILNQFLQRREE